MKGFKDSTKTQAGFDFTRTTTTTPVKMHVRAMPTRRVAPVAKTAMPALMKSKGPGRPMSGC